MHDLRKKTASEPAPQPVDTVEKLGERWCYWCNARSRELVRPQVDGRWYCPKANCQVALQERQASDSP